MSEKKVIKHFIGKVRSIDLEKKTAEVVISDETKDRYDERVLASSFKKTIKDFMKHPVLLSSHAYRGLLNQIGEFKKLSIDPKLKEVVGVVEYYSGLGNPEADWAWVLAQKGVAAFSIGFISNKTKDYNEEERAENGGVWRDFEEIELLETSQVLVPANPSALQKSFGEESEDLFLKELNEKIINAFEDNVMEDGVDWSKDVEEDGPKTYTAEEVISIVDKLIEERHLAVVEEMKLMRASWDELKLTMLSLKSSWEEMKSAIIGKEETDLGKEGEETDEGKAEAETKDGDSTESTEILEEVLGAEKVAELRGALFGYQLGDDDKLKKLFEEMNAEIKERLSVQS